jgi:hypothetical protein
MLLCRFEGGGLVIDAREEAGISGVIESWYVVVVFGIGFSVLSW